MIDQSVVASIPAEIRKENNWILWRLEQRNGDARVTKVPYQANGKYASTTDVATWTTLDEAMRVAPNFSGIGFVFNGTGVCGVDLDHCRNIDTGMIDPWAVEIIERLNSYTEISQSGTGVHVLVRARLPGDGRKRKIQDAQPSAAVEMYDTKRYFVMTGQHLSGTPTVLTERQSEIEALYGPPAEQAPPPAPRGPSPSLGSDAEIIEKAMRAKNGTKFAQLWRGDTSGHGSDDSAADLALCDHLAYWTNCDPSAIDRLFRKSGLYREKWERQDYRDATIGKALSGTKMRSAPLAAEPGTSTPKPDAHYTDLGNSERLVTAHGKDLRYVATWGKWIVFDENTGLWRTDDTGEVMRRSKRTVLDEHCRAILDEDPERREARTKWAIKSESEPALRHCVTLASTHADIATTHHALDCDPWAFVCANGTLDLRSGDLRPTRREDLATKATAVPYDPAAKCPRFLSFLDEIFCSDRELIEFFQLAFGYSLTADTREHVTFICHGSGANGKTTLMRVMERVLGSYAMTAETSTFMARDRGDTGGPRNDVARLVGARFVTSSEIGEGRRLDEGLVKSLTGGDTITARFLHQEFFEFRPAFKLWISTNHKPHVKGTDEGIWRRIRLVPFRATFPSDKQDKRLVHTLYDGAPGILAFAVRGCLAWQERGLPRVGAVEQANSEYRAEQDLLGSWLADSIEVNPLFSLSNTLLYRNFSAWCEQNGEHPWSNKAFSMRMTERGFESRKTMSGRVWQGLAIASNYSEA